MNKIFAPDRAVNPGGLSNFRVYLVWLLAAASILGALTAIVAGGYYAVDSGDSSGVLSHLALTPFITAAYAVIGALVAVRHPKNPIGWIFLSVGLLYALTALSGVLQNFTAGSDVSASFLARLIEWFSLWLWIPAIFLPTVFVFLLFPSGRLLSARWRIFLWMAVIGMMAVILGVALHPGPLETMGTGANPFGWPAAAAGLVLLADFGYFLLVPALAASLISFAIRFRRTEGIEREQMKWLLYALVFMVIGLVLGSILWMAFPNSPTTGELGIAIFSLTILGVAVAASIAILRYRLYDINLVINRTLVYGALTVGVVVIYILIVTALGSLFRAQGNPLIALFATGLIAVLFQPSRQRLQSGVDRLFYGQRDDPLAALSQLGNRLEAVISPENVLPTLVETIAQTMKLPFVAIKLFSVDGFKVAAHYGKPASDATELQLMYRGEVVGQLLAGTRGAGEPFSQSDRRLLENIAHQAGPAVHAVQLTLALQNARLQLVTAREEERRRLRRDLHDGLGATLAALNLETGVLRRTIHSDPDKAEALANEIKADIRTAIEDIRRLVYELRPPTLDQLGLVAAVRALGAQYSHQPAVQTEGGGDSSLRITIIAPEELPPLPAAVEVAAYRIVQEALTNVLHHAAASRCKVSIELATAITVEIVDDGVGLTNSQRKMSGVGFLSMRERAEELGGAFFVEPNPGGGTRVVASLPIITSK
jgi:two-component system, NarL family, sensor kinase